MTKTDFTWPKMTPRGAKHVVLCAGHLYKQFWTKKIDRVDRRGQRRSKYGPEWASFIYIYTKLLALEPSRGS